MMISRLFLLGVFVANSMMISATEKVDLQKFLDENLTEDIYDKETLENMRRAVMQYFVHMENVTQGTDFEPPNMKEYWANHPEYVEKYFGNSTILGPDDDEYEDVEPLSLLEVGGSQQGGCEVCIYVIQNKAQHQPFLCRGLRAPSQQQMCVSILVAMFWWLENQVYWMNYGCQHSSQASSWEWVKPCPAHAVCSWLQNLYDRSPFCPGDAAYRKPSSG